MQLRPNPGPQEKFLRSGADIAIYGGAAGGGKSYALLLEPLYDIDVPGFSAVIFRRTTPQIKNPGALWDGSKELYPALGGEPREVQLDWTWRRDGGAPSVVKFGHMEHENDKHDWQGSQIPLIGFDELTHFTRSQFFYMLSRNRSTSGARARIRGACNPDADSWVAEFIAWWIDQETGFPIAERGGKKRWFVMEDDQLVWGDSRESLSRRFGKAALPKSVTFIPAKVEDNRPLLEKDPRYLANLRALPRVERERLLSGNWKIRPAAGLHFSRAWVTVVDEAPPILRAVRYWDLAATEKTPANDPDWTCGVKLARLADGHFIVLHAARMRENAGKVRRAIGNIASSDGASVAVGIPQDPGQAGKDQVQTLTTELAGYDVRARAESGDKITRFGPFSSQCEQGNVLVLRGAWNEWFFSDLEAFPDSAHDDTVDACSGAFARLTGKGYGWLDLIDKEMREHEQGESSPLALPPKESGWDQIIAGGQHG